MKALYILILMIMGFIYLPIYAVEWCLTQITTFMRDVMDDIIKKVK